MILSHDRIHTFAAALRTASNPWGTVQAVRVQGGRVVAAGARADVLALRERGEAVVEPEGAAVLPGLIDTHAHLHGLGLRRDALDWPDDTAPERWAEAVAALAATLAPGTWIEGRAWNQSVWTDTHAPRTADGFPTHAPLTAAAPGHPVVLHRNDRHAVWANAAAMRAASIDPDAPAPPSPEGGRVVRTADGRPSGVFVDHACDLITDAIPPLGFDDQVQVVRRFARKFLDRGVTCVHAAMVEPDLLDAYLQALEGPGAPGLRVRAMVYAEPARLAAWAEAHSPCGLAPDRFAITTLKAFADGALGSRGAWMFDDYDGYPGERGFPVATPEELAVLAGVAARRGWQLATHAIGDRAIHETLTAYDRAAAPDRIRALRWRVEHFQHGRPEDTALAARLGVRVSMQPIHCTRDMRFAEALLGASRSAFAYPWRDALDAGLTVGFGSDFPIESLDPWEGVHAAVTRQDAHGRPVGGWIPAQRLNRAEALTAYLATGAALCPIDDGHLGHLGPGAIADAIATDLDPTEIAPERLPDLQVTWRQLAEAS